MYSTKNDLFFKIQVLDSRDPNGCRCPQLEEQALAAGKRVVLIMNKVDLVPKPTVKAWLEGIVLKFAKISRFSIFKHASVFLARFSLRSGGLLRV